jgi:hypothetical protein
MPIRNVGRQSRLPSCAPLPQASSLENLRLGKRGTCFMRLKLAEAGRSTCRKGMDAVRSKLVYAHLSPYLRRN